MNMNKSNKRQASSSVHFSDSFESNESWQHQGEIKIEYTDDDKSKIVIYNSDVSTTLDSTASVTNTGSSRRKSKLTTLPDNDTYNGTQTKTCSNKKLQESSNNLAVFDNTNNDHPGSFVIEETEHQSLAASFRFNATGTAMSLCASLPELEVIPLDSMNEGVSNEVEIACEPDSECTDDNNLADFPHHFLSGFTNSSEADDPSEPVASSSDLFPIAYQFMSNNQDMKNINTNNEQFTMDSQWMSVPNVIQVFVCPLCNMQFTDCSVFNHHYEEIHRNNATVANNIKKLGIFVCPACPKSFNQHAHLQQHWRLLHASRVHLEFFNEKRCGMWYCPHCLKAFQLRNFLEQHVKLVHQPLGHKCSSCNRTFISKDNFDRHTRVCRKIKALEVREEEEVKINIAKDQPRWKCRLCKKTLKSLITLEQHIQMMHATNSRILLCQKSEKR